MAAGPTNDAPHYVPILKGRLGEFKALGEFGLPPAEKLTPLLEVPPSSIEFNDDGEPDAASISSDIARFVERLAKRWPRDRRLIVDASLFPARTGGAAAIVNLARELGQDNYTATPTIRPSDPDGVIAGVAEEIDRWGLEGACIRLSGEDLDDSDQPVADAIDRVTGLLRCQPDNIDLVLDLGSVSDEKNATFAARIARLVLADVPHAERWRTLVVASGAFPSDLGGVAPNVPTELPRYDATLWLQVAKRSKGRTPDYGDYGVANPVQSSSAGFAPAPQLRYTTAASWLVLKGRRRERRGSAQVLDLCARITAHNGFTPNLTWGDRWIESSALASTDEGNPRTGGNAMIWRAVGTSHHLGLVASRLAKRGEP